MEKHEEALVDEERWRSLHEVKLNSYLVYEARNLQLVNCDFISFSPFQIAYSWKQCLQNTIRIESSWYQDDSELDAAAEEEKKRSQGSAQIGLNYENLEPGAEVEGNTFGPEYKWVATLSWD